ncbi:MAG: PAS domain S-box protein [Spirochaetia bacterium]|nr:PAS domain S-box protein [Spirochaetia bacterium]
MEFTEISKPKFPSFENKSFLSLRLLFSLSGIAFILFLILLFEKNYPLIHLFLLTIAFSASALLCGISYYAGRNESSPAFQGISLSSGIFAILTLINTLLIAAEPAAASSNTIQDSILLSAWIVFPAGIIFINFFPYRLLKNMKLSIPLYAFSSVIIMILVYSAAGFSHKISADPLSFLYSISPVLWTVVSISAYKNRLKFPDLFPAAVIFTISAVFLLLYKSEVISFLSFTHTSVIIALFILINATVNMELQRLRSMLEDVRKNLLLKNEIIRRIPTGIILSRIDSGTILYVNPQIEKLFGYKKEEILGMNVSELYALEKEEAEAFKNSIMETVREKGIWSGETLSKSKYGNQFLCHSSGTIFKDEILGDLCLGVHKNISEMSNLKKELNQSKDLLSELTENLPELFWVRDTEGTLLYINSMWGNYTDRLPKAGESFSQLLHSLHPDDREKISLQLQASPHGGFSQNVRLKNKNNVYDWFLIRTFPVKNSEGKIYRIAGIGENISERIKTEEELKESKEIFNQFLSNSPNGMYIKNDQFQMIFMNQKAIEMSREIADTDWMGKTVFEIFPEEAAHKAHKEEKETLNGKDSLISTSVLNTPEGLRHYRTIRFPIHLSGGKRLLGGQIQDITDSINTENELRTNESMLAEAQRISHLGSWELNLINNHLTWSDEIFNIFEIDKNNFEASYEAFLHTIHPDDRDSVNLAYSNSVKDKQNYEIKHRLLMEDGRIKYVQEQGRTFYNDNGDPIRSIGTVHDITEQVLSENKIKSSLNEKEILLKEIHHRVKNNLQIISSLLYLQSSTYEPSVQKIFHESQNRVSSMALIHEKLYQSNDLSHIPFKEYMNDLAYTLISSFGMQEGIQVEISGDEIMLDIVSAVPCGLIINEIISNSMKHAFPDKKGTISLSFHQNHDMYVLQISDDGKGIPENFHTKKESSLGIKLIESLTEQIEGNLIYPEPHKKTVFEISFPVKEISSLIETGGTV